MSIMKLRGGKCDSEDIKEKKICENILNKEDFRIIT